MSFKKSAGSEKEPAITISIWGLLNLTIIAGASIAVLSILGILAYGSPREMAPIGILAFLACLTQLRSLSERWTNHKANGDGLIAAALFGSMILTSLLSTFLMFADINFGRCLLGIVLLLALAYVGFTRSDSRAISTRDMTEESIGEQ